jgi:hypothetical protein
VACALAIIAVVSLHGPVSTGSASGVPARWPGALQAEPTELPNEPSATPANREPASSDEASPTHALREGDVYVAERARELLSVDAEGQLRVFAAQKQAQGHTVKLAVLERPPPAFRALSQWVEAAHGTLGLGEGILVAVAMDAGTGSGSVSARTAALDGATIELLQQRNVATFTAVGNAEGLRALSEDLIAEISARRAAGQERTQSVVAALLLLVATLLVAFGIVRAVRWLRRLTGLRKLHRSLLPVLRRLDQTLPSVAHLPEGTSATDLYQRGLDAYRRGAIALDGLSIWHGLLPRSPWARMETASRALRIAHQQILDANALLEHALDQAADA